jgi:hypothetical protein
MASASRIKPGDVYGQLTVLHDCGTNQHKKRIWRCQCACGNQTDVIGSLLLRGTTRSCGCLRRVTASENARKHCTKHGMSQTSTYASWVSMRERCYNPKNTSYPCYGGKGIQVCNAWLKSFERFLADMGPRPSKLHSIDRKCNDRGYEPGNCRWATRQQQARNRKTNRLIDFRGETVTSIELAERHGIPVRTFRARLNNGWSVERAVSVPVYQGSLHQLTVYTDGAEVPILELARQNGLSYNIVFQRIHTLGWTLHQAATKPSRRGRNNHS